MPIPTYVENNVDNEFVYHQVNNEYLEGLQERNQIVQQYFTNNEEELLRVT